jgi:hypothetical protein
MAEDDAAEPGSAPPDIGAFVRTMRAFYTRRNAMVIGFVGREIRWTRLRTDLVQIVIQSCAAGQNITVAEAVKECEHLGSAPNIRTEIKKMVDLGFFSLVPVKEGARASWVRPTRRFLEFYIEAVRELRSMLSGSNQ